VPELFAHGFRAADNTEVEYQMSEYYQAELVAGFRYDDPAFGLVGRCPSVLFFQPGLGWRPFS